MVLNREEVRLARSAASSCIYSEQYIVKYTYQKDDGYWTTAMVSYFTENKGENQLVERRFRQDMQGKAFHLISIMYQ